MIDAFKILAIIPARGGSKRIPNKNIKELAGKPLIGYTIDAAKKSAYIDRIVTSTDSSEIADVAKRLGSEVPFMRPAEISGDGVTDYPVIVHAIEEMEKSGFAADIIVQLRPTSPLRTTEHIDTAIKLLAAHPEADSVRTVTEPEQSPYKMYSIDENGFLNPLLSIVSEVESFNLPAQKLPKAYKHVGYVDAVWRRTLKEKGKMTGEKVIPYILKEAHSGINIPRDWDYYEHLFLMRQI